MSRSDLIDHEKQNACKCLVSCEWPLRVDPVVAAINEIRKDLMGVKWQIYDALTG